MFFSVKTLFRFWNVHLDRFSSANYSLQW